MVRKTQEHLEAEKNLKGKEGEELKISKQRRKCKARRILQEAQKVKSKQNVCHSVYCEREGEITGDKQRWKEELERYSKKKYQDAEMREKAKEELDEWDEKRQEEQREKWRKQRTKVHNVCSHAEQSLLL